MRKLLKEVIFDFTKNKEGARHLKTNYDIDGVVPAHHKDYEWIRKAILKVPD
jgi:ABC-type phosphate/phosphonate transport system substrate-binding protein